jgi:hypothetical protein
MALSMPKGLGSRRQAILLGVLAVILLLFVVRWRPGGSEPASPSPSPVAGPARPGNPVDPEDSPIRARRASGKEVSPDEVPILKPEDFGPAKGRGPADPGRDLFQLREPTRVPPPTPTPRPPQPCEALYVGPCIPTPVPTPRPPEITFKFVGTFGPKEHPIAVIQQGEQTYNARAGDTLFGKFVLRKVGYESIDVGFVGFAESETKRLGISQ